MPVKYGKFTLPERIIVDEATQEPQNGLQRPSQFVRYVISPFERGFGHTLGNSLRRVLLTALESPAIVSVRIDGIVHEYTAAPGILEDMTTIVLNLKGALLRKLPLDDAPLARDSRILSREIEVTQADLDRHHGAVRVTLGMLIPDGTFEVVNPSLPIFTVTQPTRRQVDLRIAFGRGYVPSERQVFADRVEGEIIIDAIHSPVRLVNYYVQNTRVGQDTDFDKLILEITTDGRVTPQEALNFAVQIVLKHFEVFLALESLPITFDEGQHPGFEDQDELLDKLLLGIDEIELSVRSANCLAGANIETLAELVSIPERRLLEFRNFGKKSLNEIKDKLAQLGLGLGMNLAPLGITADNAKERAKQYREERAKRKDMIKHEEK